MFITPRGSKAGGGTGNKTKLIYPEPVKGEGTENKIKLIYPESAKSQGM